MCKHLNPPNPTHSYLSMMVMYFFTLAWLSFSWPAGMMALEKPGIMDITCGCGGECVDKGGYEFNDASQESHAMFVMCCTCGYLLYSMHQQRVHRMKGIQIQIRIPTWLMGPIFMMFWNCSYMMRSVNSPLLIRSSSSCCWSSCGGEVSATRAPRVIRQVTCTNKLV